MNSGLIPRRVAVLVDGDNVSATHADRILDCAGRLGRVDIRRVYRNAAEGGWQDKPGFRMIQVGGEKNAADVVLSIEAMELALEAGIGTFVIVSSDRDLAHVALRLRERGNHVLGLGEMKAPPSFRQACNEFRLLECGTSLEIQVREIISIHSQSGRGMLLRDLNPEMRKKHRTKISETPHKNWRQFVKDKSGKFELVESDGDTYIRFLKEGLAAG